MFNSYVKLPEGKWQLQIRQWMSTASWKTQSQPRFLASGVCAKSLRWVVLWTPYQDPSLRTRCHATCTELIDVDWCPEDANGISESPLSGDGHDFVVLAR